jgi:hypothetical protein
MPWPVVQSAGSRGYGGGPFGHYGSMVRPSTELIQVAALCQMLLDSLERLDDELASEALVADLRELCERVHAELERGAPSAE